MKFLTMNEIRRKWLDFFKSKGHMEFESKSLVPIDDNSLLWINSGVATLKKYFSGQENPASNRITNSQRCIRTNDIENVGVTSRHHTLFEMLGNFSVGDYFKEEAIEFAYELLTKVMEFELEKLYVTVYEEDDIAYKKWVELGISENHIVKCNKDRNFWDLGSGPCGPCTEMYYDRGEQYDPEKIGERLFFEDLENDRYVEIWNIVFSEFNNDGNGNYTQLARKNIDTGAGLERLASIVQEVPTDFDIDSFIPLIKTVEKYSDKKYDTNAYFTKDEEQIRINKNYRVIADHFKACTFAISDGAIPSNKDRGYIIRKLIRRAKVSLLYLGVKTNDVVEELVKSVSDVMNDYYPYLENNVSKVSKIILTEINLFESTLKKTESIFKECLVEKKISGERLFHLVDTYGFPIEIIKEIQENKSFEELKYIFNFEESEIEILKQGLDVDFDEFERQFEKHKEISKKKDDTVNFDVQNKALLALDVKSEFDYNLMATSGKVVKLYNKDFEEVETLNNEDGYVVLDKTCFYATSGGQQHDIGKIKDYFVTDVIKSPNGIHVHKIKSAVLKIDEVVPMRISWSRRRHCGINHSTEHLIHAALKAIIDPNIKQEGAYKSDKKLTFDFQLSRKLTDEEIKQIEEWIVNVSKQEIPVEVIYASLDEAKKMGATAYFEDVYKKIKGDLRIVKMGDVSMELCGGTHIPNTKYIENFKIIKCSSLGSGSWRLDAISTNENINEYLQTIIDNVKETITIKREQLKENNIEAKEFEELAQEFESKIKNPVDNFNFIATIEKPLELALSKAMVEFNKGQEKVQIEKIKEGLKASSSTIACIHVDNYLPKAIQLALTEIINEVQDVAFFVINSLEDKVQFYGAENEKFTQYDIGQIIKDIAGATNGKGGGKRNFAQGGTSEVDSVKKIVEILEGIA